MAPRNSCVSPFHAVVTCIGVIGFQRFFETQASVIDRNYRISTVLRGAMMVPAGQIACIGCMYCMYALHVYVLYMHTPRRRKG